MYPSVISTFSYPSASDKLNNPSHSALENSQSSVIGQMQAFMGLEGDSSVAGTLVYDVRSPASNGGGHVQTAALGGTGQTTYAKGDMLVGQNSSTLTRITVGSDGLALTSDSTTATGVKWGTPPANKILTYTSVLSLNNTTASIMTTQLVGSVLGTTNALKSTIFVKNFSSPGGESLTLKGVYGTSSIAVAVSGLSTTSTFGTINFDVVGAGTTTTQKAYLTMNVLRNGSGSVIAGLTRYSASMIATDSSAVNTFGIEATVGGPGTNELTTEGYIIEKVT